MSGPIRGDENGDNHTSSAILVSITAVTQKLCLNSNFIQQASSHAKYTELASLPVCASKKARSLFALPRERDISDFISRELKNLDKRSSNLEAALVMERGQIFVEDEACDYCQRVKGHFTQCIRLHGYLHNSCANCHCDGDGTRCQFHDQYKGNVNLGEDIKISSRSLKAAQALGKDTSGLATKQKF